MTVTVGNDQLHRGCHITQIIDDGVTAGAAGSKATGGIGFGTVVILPQLLTILIGRQRKSPHGTHIFNPGIRPVVRDGDRFIVVINVAAPQDKGLLE